MKRQIIPVERVVKCHVNSLDNGASYEAGTAYEAGTLVTYNGNSYTAIVDIEDTDTDTPSDAPEKWALTPDAFESFASDPSLVARVTALEDFDDALPSGYVITGADFILHTLENGTYSEGLDALAADAFALAQSLPDDEAVMPYSLEVQGAYTYFVRGMIRDNTSPSFNIVGNAISEFDPIMDFSNLVAYSGSGTSKLGRLRFTVATSSFAYTDMTETSAGASRNFVLSYLKLKKIKNS